MSVSAADLAGATGLAVAFGAGLASFLSPCVLPLVPSYLAVLGGTSRSRAQTAAADGPDVDVVPQPNAAWRALPTGLAFVLGFSLVFIALGATASSAGRLVLDHAAWIAAAGGTVLVLLGLHLLELVRVPLLAADTRRFDRLAGRGATGVGAFAIGATFAAGWSPCIGPVLAGVLALAAAEGTASHGMLLLACYSAGLAVPFLVAAAAIDRVGTTSGRLRAWSPVITRVSGALLVAFGLLLVTGQLAQLSGWAARFTPGGIG